MQNNPILRAEHYERIDGKHAYQGPETTITLGAPMLNENGHTPIAVQIWKADQTGQPALHTELPLHQVMDLMLVLGHTMAHFRSAYRLPLLYDPQNPDIARVGLQGDALTLSVCTENPNLSQELAAFSQALSDLGELTGERLRSLTALLHELN